MRKHTIDKREWASMKRAVEKGDIVLHLWDANEVRELAEQIGVELTREECRLVLALFESLYEDSSACLFACAFVMACVKKVVSERGGDVEALKRSPPWSGPVSAEDLGSR